MTFDIDKLVNKGVNTLQPYVPGKPIEDLERELGIKDAIKLASNENPLGPSPLALKAVNEVLSGLNRYPDGNALRLKEAISRKYNIEVNKITIGNGSNDIIEFVVRCFLSSEDSAVFSKHAFAVYPLAVQSVGAEGIEVDANNWGHDLSAMASSIKKNTKVIFIANPNNPTGTFVPRDEIITFLKTIKQDVIVLLDQAYYEYSSYETEDVDFELINEFPNLIISRSFSKAYGLAGFRIGYSVSTKEVADLLNRIRQPFNANSLALIAAETALKDREHMEKSLKTNIEQKELLYKGLDNLGFEYIASAANFICFDCKQNSQEMYKKLLQESVIVRSMEVYKMLNHLRVSIGTPEENLVFLKKLAKVSN